MKKYTLKIYFKQDNHVIKIVNTNNLKYINKILFNFFYTLLGTPTKRLLDYKYTIYDNEENYKYNNYWPDRLEIEYNMIINADPSID